MTSEVVSRSTMSEVTKSGQEVASAAKPPEGDQGAAPSRASTPAPVVTATSRKDGTHVKTPHQVPTQRQEKKQQEKKQQQSTMLDTAGKTCTVVWIAGQLACASPEARVRPPVGNPPPAPCPAGSEESMKELGVGIGANNSAAFFINGEPVLRQYISVRPGQSVSLTTLTPLGELPAHSLYTGVLLFGDGRVYGRFTQAQTPQGWPFTVCFEVYGNAAKPELKGLEMKPGSGPDAAKIFSTVYLRAVRRFE